MNLELSEHQQSLGTSVRDLSSGLRVNTAADDPSGNAIATTLQTHSQAFDTASQNITNAQNTNFNGRALLDGSIAGYQPAQSVSAIVESNSILLSSSANTSPSASTPLLLAGATTFDHAQFPPIDATLNHAAVASAAPQTISVTDAAYISPGMVFSSGNVLVTVQSVDASAGTIIATFSGALAAGAEMHAYMYGTSTGPVAVGQHFYDTATQTSVTSPFLLSPGESAALYDGVVTTLGDFGSADVGSTAYIKVLQSVAATNSNTKPDLTVQSGSDEGDVIQLGIPAVNTNTLRVSAVTVIGADGADPTLASEDAIGQVDYALQQVTTTRAQVGAQIVKLSIDETNDDTAATELTASQSNITDLNVGAATEEFTEQQIDIDVTTSLLTQVNNLPEAILKLFPPP